ncbi:hypothetical protein [Sphingomonas sp. KR3-1]|uniref:hypothetical protein n=1 Tax=Sphingomonas sp. KR3-1 TaxID=3156611 RepID=UPI0032B469CE
MRLLPTLLALFLATPAWADTIATYSAQGGMMTMTVEIATTGEMRVTMGGKMLEQLKAKAPAGMDLDQFGGIVRDGENYMLQPGPDGKVRVIRMRDAAAVMKEFMAAHMADFSKPPEDAMQGPKLVARGTATINGRTGKAFYGADAKASTKVLPVAVISTDPDLAKLGEAMRRQFATSMQMMGSAGFPAMGSSMDAVLAQGAPLAFAGMELQTVRHDAIPPARFVLPAEPASLDQVRELMTPKKIAGESEAAEPRP